MIVGLALGAVLLGAAGDPQTAPLSALADQITAQIIQAAPEPPLAIDLSGPAESEGLFTLLAARLSAAHLAPAALHCQADCDDAALRSGARTRVRLTLTKQPQAWEAGGELHGVWRNFWAGARDVRPPSPAAALHASVLTGASEVPPPATLARTLAAHAVATVPGPIEAIAAADLDGDGSDELLALTDRALWAFDPSGRVLGQHPLDALARAAVVSRDPIGALAVEPSPLQVFAFSQNRARGERLTWDAAAHAFRATGSLDAPRLGCAGQTFAVAFTPGESTFEPARPPAPLPRVPHRTSALVCRLTGAGGVFAFVLPDGSGQLQLPQGRRALHGVGAGIGLVDLDGDGTPELLTSSALITPDPDTLTITGGADAPRTLSVPGRILFITAVRRAGQGREAALIAAAQADGQTALSLVEVEEVSP